MRSVSVLTALLLGACGGSGAFGLTADDNNPAKLQAALQAQDAPPAGRPLNATGKPLAFLVASGKPQSIIAYDLAAKQPLWKVEAAVGSRIVVGGDFIAHKGAGSELVARNLTTGAEQWRQPLAGEFLGAAADRQRVFYTVKSGGSTWTLVALDGATGAELWRRDADGRLGAPAARGGLVFSPFLRQWLGIIDAGTGRQLTRVRGLEEEIAFIRTTGDGVYFGSRSGVFLLDQRAASGKPSESTYGQATLPEEFVRQHYYWDAYDPIQAGYSAYDRNRILWRASAGDGGFGFRDQNVVVHTYRFFFAFDATSGQLEWAYSHPRQDLVASAHAGDVIGFVSTRGAIGALDPATGKRVYAATAEVGARLVGATFDAEGWAPAEEVAEEVSGTVEALASIARDRDARFNDVKRFAVTALATLPGGEVTRDLIGLIQSERTPQKLHEKTVEVLIARRDPSGLPHLVEALSVDYDFIEGTRPRAVGVMAQAIAALDPAALDGAARERAVEALLTHLHTPETPASDLAHVIRALGVVGQGAELGPLSTFLLAYRADPAFASQTDALAAAVDVLLGQGGAAERELVAFLAADGRTQPSVAEYATTALAQTRPDAAPAGGAAAPAAAGAP
jgi:outer membrane protein assembly factor BamB